MGSETKLIPVAGQWDQLVQTDQTEQVWMETVPALETFCSVRNTRWWRQCKKSAISKWLKKILGCHQKTVNLSLTQSIVSQPTPLYLFQYYSPICSQDHLNHLTSNLKICVYYSRQSGESNNFVMNFVRETFLQWKSGNPVLNPQTGGSTLSMSAPSPSRLV
jgi:hypothetical protein